MLRVVMMGMGNPDYGQSVFTMVAPVQVAMVNDLAEASIVCRNYIAEHNLGGGNWRGEIFDNAVELVAVVSYNGRVWSPEPWPDCTLLYDPYQEADKEE